MLNVVVVPIDLRECIGVIGRSFLFSVACYNKKVIICGTFAEFLMNYPWAIFNLMFDCCNRINLKEEKITRDFRLIARASGMRFLSANLP